ncbi:hypothetical protein TrLO_g5732 [Triparma laevis f. longispina]|uniref:LisH domain-containing protein n=1 Tax=Triparma laevis f. longispina TaxID=1714387 RepID=A0A9W7AM81_9STRA|nr:hypothetical protein TrLO_g5732 [Triparma laevis f. longispina]
MSSIIEEDSQLRKSVYTALESKGVLNSVRAKLRSEVFQAIQEADGKVISPFDRSVSNLNALSLVFDFLNTYNFPNAASVLSAECGIAPNDNSLNLESVSKAIGYDVTAGPGSALNTVISGATMPVMSPRKSGSEKGFSGVGGPPSGLPPPPPESSSSGVGAVPISTTTNTGKQRSRSKSPTPNDSPVKAASPPVTKVNRNVRLDISDDSVDDIVMSVKASSPSKLESLGENTKLAPLEAIVAAGGVGGKPKLASLSPGKSSADPFSKAVLPSPTPSPSESLESSLELTSNSLSMSFGNVKDVLPSKSSPTKDSSLDKSGGGKSVGSGSPAPSPAKSKDKAEESYEDDYEDDYESGGSFDSVDDSVEEIDNTIDVSQTSGNNKSTSLEFSASNTSTSKGVDLEESVEKDK